jgi:hypothetical protein
VKIGKVAQHVLGSVAPTIARTLGGPFGNLAAQALEAIFPGDSQAKIEQQLANATPDLLVKLKDAEHQFKIRTQELELTEEQLFLEDVQDSRLLAREKGLAPHMMLTALFIGGYFAIFMAVLSGYVAPAEGLKDMALILLGVLAGEVPRIMSWWFGSTKGSSDKNQYMAAIAGLKE